MASTKKETPAIKKGKSQGNATSPGLKVTAKLDGFCRAGLSWSERPTVVKLSDLGEDQIAEIKRCPGLIVTEVEVEDDEQANAADDDEAAATANADTSGSESQGESA